MSGSEPRALRRLWVEVREGLATLARYRALAVLAEAQLDEKLIQASEVAQRIDQAARVDRFLQRHLQEAPATIAWQADWNPETRGLVENDEVRASLWPAISELEASLAAALTTIAEEACASVLGEPQRTEALSLRSTLPEGRPGPLPSEGRPTGEATRVLRGPRSPGLDPVFQPAFSLLDGPEPTGPNDFDRAPGFWCLAIREAMAAELCALCIVEYDGLPLAYYEDFGKQCADEARHAVFYLRAAIELLPGFLRDAPADHPLLEGACRYLRTGEGLGVPVEGNLYEVARLATLEERLVLMHVDTEGPSIRDLLRDLDSPFVSARPWLRRDLELTAHDEAAHARLGARWLHALVPDRQQRSTLLARTRLLRGLYVATAMAEAHGLPLPQVISQICAR